MGSCGEASERLESGLDVVEFAARDQTATKRLPCGLAQQLRGQAALRAVAERAARARRGHRAEPGSLLGCDVGMMKHDTGWNAKPARAPGRGEREMHLRRQHVGEAVERQRGLV